ncbi:MAG: hypothetical protein JEZ06_21505 [Anaerolineaceae bacterium]|nr:hypothetical protein [Anaerolineaceae bacterium]
MRIIDDEKIVALDSILLMLTQTEASELVSKLKKIDPNKGDHIHVNDIDFAKEITIAIYTEDNLHYFSEDIQKIIETS